MWKYISTRHSISGVPERDLTDSEMDAFDSALREIVVRSGFYEYVSDSTAPATVEVVVADEPVDDAVDESPKKKRASK